MIVTVLQEIKDFNQEGQGAPNCNYSEIEKWQQM